MKRPKPIDTIIAKNLRKARLGMSLSLQEIADDLGITYQQVQKYENAKNRISAGRLWELSVIYNTPIEDLFKSRF